MLYQLFLRCVVGDVLPCDSLICTSTAASRAVENALDYLREEVNRASGGNVRRSGRVDVIPLCIDTSSLQPLDKTNVRRELNLPEDAFIILYLGRISPLKADLLPFLPVLDCLVRENPGRRVLWILAGTHDPLYPEYLLRYASEIGLCNNIQVSSYVSGRKKTLLIPAADVLVCPSDTVDETFGLAPVEAMACGVPQVVPDWDGYRDTVSHGETGFLVPTYWTNCSDDLTFTGVLAGSVFDRIALGQSIVIDLVKTRQYLQYLMNNEQLGQDMGRRSRERALRDYSPESVVKRYETLWDELADIASRIAPDSTAFHVDEVRYHELFGHYASLLLSDETKLRITDAGYRLRKVDANKWPALVASRFIDRRVVINALDELCGGDGAVKPRGSQDNAAQHLGSITLGMLLETLSRRYSLHAHHLRRHVMWILKYGWAEPVFE
jgi:glycosyltransferase involved in cell wall biosynthesis